MFEPNEFGPTLAAQVTFIGRGTMFVLGGTTDTEAWVLSVLSKKAKNIFEFGTCTGKTAYLMAANSPIDAKVHTLTLPPDKIPEYAQQDFDDVKGTEMAKQESTFTRFLYNNTPVEHKVIQLFMDSKKFDESIYKNSMDLVFIDGSHARSYVMSDTKKSLNMLKKGGLLLWHDYRSDWLCGDVHDAIDWMRNKMDIKLIDGTTIAIYRKDSDDIDIFEVDSQ